MKTWCLLISLSVTQAALAVQPDSANAPPPPAQAAKDWGKLSIDEVIQALPQLRDEMVWDATATNIDGHPACEELARRMATVKLTDAQWDAALRKSMALCVRPKWPKNVPLVASIDVPRWLGIAKITASPALPAVQPIHAGDLEPSDCGFGRDWGGEKSLGVLPADSKGVTFTVKIEIGGGRYSRGGLSPGVLWTGQMAFPVQQVASFDDVIGVASGAGIDAAMKEAIGAGWRDWPLDLKGNATVVSYVNVAPDVTEHPILAGLVLDTIIEVLCDGKVVEKARIDTIDECPTGWPRSLWGLQYYNSENLVCRPDTSGRWSLRVTGGGAHLDAMPRADKRWKGQFTLTWDEAIAHEKRRLEERERKFKAAEKPAK